MIEFRPLGSLHLTDAEGREVKRLLTRSRRLALLAYLAAATPRGFHRRDSLLAVLWPELDPDHARAALREPRGSASGRHAPSNAPSASSLAHIMMTERVIVPCLSVLLAARPRTIPNSGRSFAEPGSVS
ncbi:MAG: hypothetical protein E6J45_01485 [Chloroflexi bacterium]|nr:MAG: hypothetical protein E6J45_01485 [Chloroflexota bacterium]